MYYLYVKTHNKTGLKYLGKTKRNPHKYQGSGKYWKRHIKKHGYDVKTEIILTTDNIQILKDTGIYYSNLWNIVESSEWANYRPENGDGGDTSKFINYAKRTETFLASGYKHTSEINKKAVLVRRSTDNYIHMKTENQKRLQNGTHNFQLQWKCEHCGITGKNQINYIRWHGNNCKKKGD